MAEFPAPAVMVMRRPKRSARWLLVPALAFAFVALLAGLLAKAFAPKGHEGAIMAVGDTGVVREDDTLPSGTTHGRAGSG